MSYHVVDPADLEPEPDRPSEMRAISDAVGLSHLGLRLYDVAPGEDVPISGLHYHDRQEEAFYVVDGTIEVETPDRQYRVDRGQFFVAEPESPHRAFNDSAADVNATVIGIGAPPGSDAHPYEG